MNPTHYLPNMAIVLLSAGALITLIWVKYASKRRIEAGLRHDFWRRRSRAPPEPASLLAACRTFFRSSQAVPTRPEVLSPTNAKMT